MQGPTGGADGLGQLVEEWANALADAGHAAMGEADARRLLRDLAERFVDALRERAAGRLPAPGRAEDDAGRLLVEAHFVGPEVLGRTLLVLRRHLSPAITAGSPLAPLQNAFEAGLEALTAGYVQALRNRTLAQQEALRRAEITARRSVEEELRASESRFREVFARAGIGMLITDFDGRVVEANQALADMVGYVSPDVLVGIVAVDIVLAETRDELARLYQELKEGRHERLRLEIPCRHQDGHTMWLTLTATTLREANGGPRFTLSMVEDVSEQRRLRERLRYQAMHDPLTQLPNRTLFFDRLDLVFSRSGSRVGLCYVDLDGFKAINDTLGHHVGDELLVAVAERLFAAFGPLGHMVARISGDEFVILVEDSHGSEQVAQLAQRALNEMEKPFDVATHRLSLTASIGVIERPVDGSTPTELMKAADATLYWAKADGKARWTVFDPERNQHQMTRQALSTTMRSGLEHGEFFLEYQPLVNLDTGVIKGVEALVRWQHPRFGRLGPDRFIPIAEETGAVVPLGRWVLQEACRQARWWQLRHPSDPIYVSVNLAARQMWDSDVVGDVAAVLNGTGLPPRLLQLELTESAVMGPAGRPLEALRALAGMGVRIAIDDFGTGYSNLAYLNRLPVHELKLDGSFIEGLQSAEHPNPADAQIVAAVVQLAHGLGLGVTAEGVETLQQAKRLRDTGCDTAQGWYYARAQTPESITALLGRGLPDRGFPEDRKRGRPAALPPLKDAAPLKGGTAGAALDGDAPPGDHARAAGI
ncbi:hypothetical protein BIV57_06580 [Mangrovactinospora gilvigrisea]|uniref:GGDEF domain-containing protein n=1 Tax=Mangrovactinospora gilvigrisea TaxID=1428644 RepID=A0A1J7C9W5_9ACTN|nr:GGDEF domain-containing phosphodiesterase [Mangrovactinospora gilvigrisea]OIV38320.1 hypothetical protein BIV57_06580 [Mangrovactinospora gilvigrisea]